MGEFELTEFKLAGSTCKLAFTLQTSYQVCISNQVTYCSSDNKSNCFKSLHVAGTDFILSIETLPEKAIKGECNEY